MKKLLIIWGKWGPYHYARFQALQKVGKSQGWEIHGMEYSDTSKYYSWELTHNNPHLKTLNVGQNEMKFSLTGLIKKAFPYIHNLKPDVLVIPGYLPWPICISIFGKLIGSKNIITCTTHSDSTRKGLLRILIKKLLIKLFDAGMAGGTAHIEYLESLGMTRVFTGYNAVDNDYFQAKAITTLNDPQKYQENLHLPDKYFLSIGKLTPLKNVDTAIHAFAQYREQHEDATEDLVIVGNGDQEKPLKTLARSLSLRVIECHDSSPEQKPDIEAEPTVYFYGYRQIKELPTFYALASAFILASHNETWGLVINEAMAAGTPVIASNKAAGVIDLMKEPLRAADIPKIKHAELMSNGITFDPDHPEALCACLHFISTHPLLAQMMARGGKDIIKSYSTEVFAENLINAASDLINYK